MHKKEMARSKLDHGRVRKGEYKKQAQESSDASAKDEYARDRNTGGELRDRIPRHASPLREALNSTAIGPWH